MPEDEQLYTNVKGTIMNKNTIEEFKSIDKAALLSTVGKTILAGLKDKIWITKPNSLLNFIILSFAVSWDLNYIISNAVSVSFCYIRISCDIFLWDCLRPGEG